MHERKINSKVLDTTRRCKGNIKGVAQIGANINSWWEKET